jgi:hypothetical protein
MIMHKYILSPALLIGAALVGAPASAQASKPNEPSTQTQSPATAGATATVKASDTIYGPDGNPVGTIQSVQGDSAVLATGTATVRIPVSVISQGPKGATIALTKAEVEAKAQSATPPK